jgi:diadenosine tetraphosphatase ApaH/serine/threonine PP2A family protein phosphatase
LKAIVSDIHGNLEAFQAVLDDIQKKEISEIYCLGDVVGYGPNPVECLQIARRFKIIIMGNHEKACLETSNNFNQRAKAAISWTRRKLDEAGLLDYLNTLPERTSIDGVMCVHGSPLDPVKEYIVPHYAVEKTRLAEIFQAVDNFCFVGHTHIPGIFRDNLTFTPPEKLLGGLYMLEPGKEKAIINVGSVGQPRDGNPQASYITFDGDSVVFRRVPYDYTITMKKIEAIHDLDIYLAKRLALGR